MTESYATQLIYLSSVKTAETFLRNNFVNPKYVKAVERLIALWNSVVTDENLIKMMKDMQLEEDEKLK